VNHPHRYYSTFRMTVIEERVVTLVGRRSEPTVEPGRIQRLRLPLLVSLVALTLPLLRTHRARALFGGAIAGSLKSVPGLRRLHATGRVRVALPPDHV
jgi:hypothetical protein